MEKKTQAYKKIFIRNQLFLIAFFITGLFSCRSVSSSKISDLFSQPKFTIQISGGDSALGCAECELNFDHNVENGEIKISGNGVNIQLSISEAQLSTIQNLLIKCVDAYDDPVSNSVLINCAYSTEYKISSHGLEYSVYDEYCEVLGPLFEILE